MVTWQLNHPLKSHSKAAVSGTWKRVMGEDRKLLVGKKEERHEQMVA